MRSIKALYQTFINKHFVAKNIHKKFNPTVSPWMGDIWESLVKSVKPYLKVMARDKLFAADKLATLTCEVESISSNELLYL